jgi:hypothetical protein
MKHIKSYILFENFKKQNKFLYHGSPYKFKNFKNTLTFFSDNINFAESYTNTKSMDMELDGNTNIYKVTTTANIFDINNESDNKKLEKVLPDKIEYVYNDFGSGKILSKEDILYFMSGYYKIYPKEDIENYKIGDIIKEKITISQNEDYTIYNIDSEYVYAWGEERFNMILNQSINDKYSVIFSSLKKFFKEYIKTNIKYYDDNYNIYYYKFLQYNEDDISSYEYIDKNILKEFNKLNDKFKDDIIKILIDDNYIKKYNLKIKTVKFDDTWRYFETKIVLNSIKKIGYDGYVALENKNKTYAIFEPNKTIKIEDIYINGVKN